MADINITANISEAIDQLQRLRGMTDEQAQSFRNTATVIKQYNAALDTVTATVTGTINEFQTMSAVIQRSTDPAVTAVQLLSTRLKDMNEQAVQSANKANALESAFKRVSGTLTNIALYRGFNQLTHAITDSVSQAVLFEQQVARIQATTQSASTSTLQMRSSIIAVSNALGVDFKDAAEAAQAAVQSHIVSGNGLEDFTKTVGDLSKVTGSTMKDSGTALTEFMKSFGKTSDEADAAAAKLFRTTQLGSINLTQLGSEFGRVSTQAKALNITENDVLSTIILLSRHGLEGSQAIQTFATGMSKLIEPTQKVKDAMGGVTFEHVGASGGLPAILAQITKLQSQGFKPEDIFGGSRGFRGFEELLKHKDELAGINTQLNNSTAPFANAKSIVANTDADKLKRNLETIKNTLADTIGSQLVSIAAKFSLLGDASTDATGHITHGTKNAITVLEQMVALITAATVAVKLFGVESRAFTLVAGGAAGFLGGKALLSGVFGDRINNGGVGGVKGLEELRNNITAGNSSDVAKSQAEQVDKLKDGWTQISEKLSGPLRSALDDVNSRIKSSAEGSKKIKEELSAAFAGSLEKGRERLQDIQHEIQAIVELQRNASKVQTASGEHAQKATLGAMQEFANPLQHGQLVQEDINDKIAKIQKLSKLGTAEAQKEIVKLGDELQDAAAKGWSAYQKDQEAAFKKQQEDNAKAGMPVETTFFADTTSLLQNRLNIQNLIADALKHQNEEMAKQKVILEDQAKKEREKLKQQDEAIKNITDFRVTDENGKLDKKFTTETGQFDQEKFERAFKGVTAPTEAGGILQPGNLQDSLSLRSALANQRRQLLEEGRLQSAKGGLLGQLDAIQAGGADQGARLDLAKQKQAQANDTATGAIQNGIKFGEGVSEVLKRGSSTNGLNTLFGQIAGFSASGQRAQDVRDRLGGNADAINDLTKRLNDILAKPITGPNGEKRFDIDTAQGLIAQIQGHARQSGQFLQEQGANLNAPLEGTKNLSFNQALGLGTEPGKGLEQARDLQGQATAIITSATLLQAQMKVSADTFNNATKTVGDSLSQMGKAAADTAIALQAAQSLIKQSQQAQNPTVTFDNGATYDPNAPLGPNGLPVENRFFGGPLYRDYGGPIGEDSIPLWASSGEMVMNAAATSRYYSQLMGANVGSRIPQHFETGGVVNQTNNISITGEKSAEATAYKIDMLMKRAKRLGTIK